ncbi:MAG: YfhO family protein [Planctomycetota bacterium]|nr:YfhO family protein [Planctomycetota bacterium]
MSDVRPRPRFELGFAAVLCAVLATWFLWTPLTLLGQETLSPVDALQRSEWCVVDRNWRSAGDAQIDVATDVHAAYALDRAIASRDGSPAWDSRTGLGSPRAARPTASALSPFAWMHRVLPLDRAALLEAFVKLFLAGFLAYGFLAALRLASIACAFGAVAFASSGSLLEHPARAASSVAIALVGGLWLIESLARRVERDGPRQAVVLRRLASPMHAAGFALVAAFGAAAGDIEAFAWTASLLALFAFARGWSLWRRAEPASGAGVAIASIYAQYTLLALLAVGISGLFLGAFFEFQSESWVFRERLLNGVAALERTSWSTALFPNMLGDGAHRAGGNLAMLTGLAVVFCALCAPFVVRGRNTLTFFGLVALAWLAFAYDVIGLHRLAQSLPILRLVSIESGFAVFHISVAVCASFCVHRLVERSPTRNVVAAIVTVCAAIVVLFVARAGASHRVLTALGQFSSEAARIDLARDALRNVSEVSTWFALSAALLASAWLLRTRRARLAPLAVCVVVLLGQNALTFLHFHPTSPNAFVFVETAALAELRAKVSTKRPVFMGGAALPPRVASLFGVPSLADVRGAELARVERLRREWFVMDANGYDVRWAAKRGLQVFGIDSVVDGDEWVDLGTWTGFADTNSTFEYLTRPLVPDADVEFDFHYVDEFANALRVCFETGGRPLLQNIELNVEDRTTRERLSQLVLAPDFDRPNRDSRVFVAVPLPQLADGETRKLKLVVRSNDGVPESAWSLIARRDWKYVMNAGLWRHAGVNEWPIEVRHPALHAFSARQDGHALPGSIVVDMTWTKDALRDRGAIASRRLFDFEHALPEFRVVSRALAARDEDDSFRLTTGSEFDPARSVVLENIDGDVGFENHAVNGTVDVIARDDRSIRLRTSSTSSGWLVTSQPWYPGWRATVNGVEVEFLRANHAFGAVAIGAGAADVVLEFRPAHTRLGTWISSLSLALIGAWFVLALGSHLSRASRSS